MKQVLRIILIYLTFLSSNSLFAQVQGKFGNTQSALDVNAALEVESTSKGVLLPRLTTAQQNAMSAPTNGMLIYNTDSACFVLRRAGVWRSLCAANGGEAWSTLGNLGTNANTNFLGTTDNTPLSIRVNNLRSGYIDPSATQSTFFGYRAGLNNNPASGSGNTAIGSQTLVANTSGVSNTAVGANALNANVTGGGNAVLGFNGLRNATAASYNVAIGESVMSNATGGEYNTVVGASAMNNNTTGSNNTALGLFTLQSNTTGQYNVAVGSHTLIGNTTGGNNIGMGHYTLRNNTIGENNVGIGRGALEGATTANNNVALGFFAMGGAAATGSSNVGIGEYAMFRNTTGVDNIGIGRTALSYNNTGQNNVGIGTGAAYSNTTGSNNVSLGANALNAAITVSNNTAVGAGAAQYTTGGNNTSLGYNALNLNTSGTNNVGLGYATGTTNTTGSNNTFVGYQANVSTAALSNATAIGANATVGASNSLVLGNLANVGINTSTPQYKLDIDAQTGSSGNPLRLLGLNAGANSDSVLTSASGVLRRLSIPQVLANAWNILGNTGTTEGTNFIGTTDAQGLAFRTNNTEWMRLNTTGNLGIGTTTPNQQLEITQAFRFPQTTSSTIGVIYKGANRFMHDYKPAANNGNNTFLGRNAGNFTMASATASLASNNTGVGTNALTSLTEGGSNVAFGSGALQANTTGSFNAALGANALVANTTGIGNTAVGNAALQANTTGNGNTAVGNAALTASRGSNNTALGEVSLTKNTTGTGNTSIGQDAMRENTTGSSNVALGISALQVNTTASDNIAIGASSLVRNVTGASNIAIGTTALSSSISSNNIGIGHQSGSGTNIGANNTFIGHQTGQNNLTGSNITLLGYQANVGSPALTNATAIGTNTTVGASNSLVLGNNVNVGINTGIPQYKLDINAQAGSSGNPLRLLGLNAGAAGDSVLTSSSGVVRRRSVAEILGTSAWLTAGNSGTTAGTNFIGTTDAQALAFRANNTEWMRLNTSGYLGIGTTTPTSTMQVNGSFSTAISTKTAAYTATTNDHILIGNATTAAFTITLPTAVGIEGRQYVIKKTDASVNAVTIGTTGGQTIDGAATVSLSIQWQTKTVVSDGANWLIISNQ